MAVEHVEEKEKFILIDKNEKAFAYPAIMATRSLFLKKSARSLFTKS